MKEGNIEIRIGERHGLKYARIKPLGFWTDIVKVDQQEVIEDDNSVSRSTEISWSCGGQDGSLSNIQCAKNFIAGLQEAVRIAEEWDKETGKEGT